MPKLITLIALFSVFCTSGCASGRTPPARAAAAASETNMVVIASTTDFHAALDHAEGLASVIRGLRAEYGPNFFYFDSGDLFQGSLEGNLSKGRAVVSLMNALGLDAAALGNHDLDYGAAAGDHIMPRRGEKPRGALDERMKESNFPWLSANLIKTENPCHPDTASPRCKGRYFNGAGAETVYRAGAVISHEGVNGLKLCAVGVTTPLTNYITAPDFIKDARFEELKSAVENEARELREKQSCNLIVLLMHAGLQCNKQTKQCLEETPHAEALRLLQELPAGTVDVAFGGHTHQTANEVINGTPILQAGSYGRQVGVIDLVREGSHWKTRKSSFIPVPDKADSADISAMLEPYRREANKLKVLPSGSSAEEFPVVYLHEAALTNLIVDALFESAQKRTRVDFAFYNAGGVRASLPAGQLTYGDVFNVLPFENSLAIVEMKGAELRRMVEISLSGTHGTPGFHGLHIKRYPPSTFDSNPTAAAALQIDRDLNGDGIRDAWERKLVFEVTDTDSHPIDDTRMYRVATNDFIAQGGDHQRIVFDQIPAARMKFFPHLTSRDALVEFLKSHKDIRRSQFHDPTHPRVENVAP